MEIKEKYKFIYSNFATHEAPIFKEVKKYNWVVFGIDKPYYNRYPDYLINLYNTSTKHNAVINGYVKYICGRGFEVVNTALTVQEKVQINAFIGNANQDENLNEVNEKLVKDFKLFGGFYLQPIINKKGDKIAEYYHIDFSKVRADKDDEELFYFTSDWGTRNPTKNEDFKELHLFPNDFSEVDKNKDYVIVYKSYRPDLGVYPLPQYQPATAAIETDAEISNYHLNNIKNGFSGGYLINFNNGMPTEEEAQTIEKQVTEKHTGSSNAGRFVLNFSDGKDKEATVTPLTPNNLDEQFTTLSEQIKESIYIAHNVVNPSLLGVKDSQGGLNNNADELRTSQSYFQNTFVTPEQMVFERLWNTLLRINGIKGTIKIKEVEPITVQFSESTITSVLTQNEIRELLGYEPLGVKEIAKTNMSKEQAEDDFIISEFEKYGIDDSEFEILETNEVNFESHQDCLDSEELIKQRFSKNEFAISLELTNIDRQVLDMIAENPTIRLSEVATAIDKSLTETNEIVSRLSQSGALRVNDGVFEVTSDGLEHLEDNKPTEKIFVVYKYAVRSDVPKAESGSRAFCSRLMALNQSYTKDNIESISRTVGRDVWTKRGGWYHNPNTHVNTPYCRHIWNQRVVRVKN